MKTKTHSNLPIVFLCTGMIFILLSLTMLISNWLIVIGINSGFLTGQPETPLIPFLIQTGIVSIFIGVILSLILIYFALRPVGQLICAIHAVANGDFSTKIHLKYPKEFRELSESFNQMTDELAGIEILRSDFINNFSHEFKTPIVSILGFANLMKKKELSETAKEEYLTIITSECRRLSELSSNVLNLSKVESISVLTDVVLFNVSEQIREALLLLEQKWTEKKILFDLDLEECHIFGNPDLLKQVWVNLLDNAVKFSPEGERIIIRAHKNNGEFRFSVTDRGPGMKPKTQEKIFERFFQGDSSHSVEGNGLGLSLVRKIVMLHRGSILVKSKPGHGSTFTVIL